MSHYNYYNTGAVTFAPQAARQAFQKVQEGRMSDAERARLLLESAQREKRAQATAELVGTSALAGVAGAIVSPMVGWSWLTGGLVTAAVGAVGFYLWNMPRFQ